MHGRSIDRLARELVGARTRRSAIIAVLGLAGGTSSVAQGSAICRPPGVGCTRGGQCCSGLCETQRSAPRSRRNRCYCIPVCDGKVCGSNHCGGTCGVCNPGETCCGNGDLCVDLATSAAHCGACGNACGSAQSCISGVCSNLDVCSTGASEYVRAIDVAGDLHSRSGSAGIQIGSDACSANADCGATSICTVALLSTWTIEACVCGVAVCLDGFDIPVPDVASDEPGVCMALVSVSEEP